MKKTVISVMTTVGLVLLPLTVQAQFTTLHNFDGTNGAGPSTNVVVKGNLIAGTAFAGGANGYGVLYVMATDGTGYNTLHDFGANATDGIDPQGTLVIKGHTLYGTTFGGGQYGLGTLYKINLNGTGYAILHSFGNGTDLSTGYGGLTLSGKTLYGAVGFGGAYNFGGLFHVDTDGSNYQILYSFGSAGDGRQPASSPLIKGTTIYGATQVGGAYDSGTVYTLNTDGSGYHLLWSFQSNVTFSGAFPNGGLTLKGTLLYGTTEYGGVNNAGQIYSIDTVNGTEVSLHDFGSAGDGTYPTCDLVLIGKTLYGTTIYGGAYSEGTLFQIHTNGTNYAILHPFTGPDGIAPIGPLASSGLVLYGVTFYGGAYSGGTVFQYVR